MRKRNTFGAIYKATNNINNKIYIGQTWQKLSDRIWQHIVNNLIKERSCG